ncbi:HalOD1 output domain-containing protein [Natrinema soli]|uniref:HalOD1 output domain-containing protein n=1 Tax=Natrinema soli TaxID=1930624 RepID=A0ABD5SJ43_9EURY|nr:HalOD1 output domain-containing protein [Natrinema soli]
MVGNAPKHRNYRSDREARKLPSTELGPTHGIVLSDTIDSEALDRLVTTGESVSVAFSVGEYDVKLTERMLLVRTT